MGGGGACTVHTVLLFMYQYQCYVTDIRDDILSSLVSDVFNMCLIADQQCISDVCMSYLINRGLH